MHLAAGAAHPITTFQAVVIGLVQGITELFPISSLGHTVVIPQLLGWTQFVKFQSQAESPYLAFLVGLHVATALALLVFFRKDWIRIVGGGFASLGHMLRRQKPYLRTSDERLFWLLVIATVPVGVIGIVLEHELRVVFAKPLAASIFLFCNGLVLLGGERLRRRSTAKEPKEKDPSRRLATLGFNHAFFIGCAQSLSLLAGFSRSGVTMVGGLVRGLSHEDAARFAFLSATPVILAAGVYKLHDLVGPNGASIRPQILIGSLVTAVAAYISVKFLVRFFETKTLFPFAVYCLVAGALLTLRFAIF